MPKPTLKVLITGAAGQIGYSLIPLVASGWACGADQPVELVLLDIPQALGSLEGLILEIEDGAYPLLRGVTPTSDLQTAFTDIDLCLMVGGFPRLVGMDRKDLLHKNANIFFAAGKALNDYGKTTSKVVVVANPANTNCLILQQNAPKIPKENFTCLTRLDENRAKFQLAKKVGVPVGDVKRVTIWGNHSNTMVPDLEHAVVGGKQAVKEVSEEWKKAEFIPTVQSRGAAVLAARQKSSALSAANAVADHVRSWLLGTAEGEWASVGVVSDGTHYGVAEGIVFSFPTTIKDGKITVVDGLELSNDVKEGLKATEAELLGEKKIYDEYKATLE